jgi:hypothetical protein
MSSKTYDTRGRDEIIAAPHFMPFLAGDELNQIGLRELRTLDQFFGFAATRDISVPAVSDFLAFTESHTSTRRLNNLRTAFDRLLPPEAPVRQAIRDAIRAKKPRSRTCNRISRAALRTDPLMAPYHALPAFDDVALEDLRVFARFLAFVTARQITVPAVEDYLAFCADVTSSRRLRSLKAAFDILLPGNPATHVVLAEAITYKIPALLSKAGDKAKRVAVRRLLSSDLPVPWQALLRDMRLGLMPMHKFVPASSVIASMEDVLREYVKVQAVAGAPSDISIDGIRRLEASRAEHAAQRQAPRYAEQGNRPATRHTAIMRLRQFAEVLDLDPQLIADVKIHEKILRRANGTVVALKFGRLDTLPDLATSWSLATTLLTDSVITTRRQTKLRLLNEAAILALWTLLPLRLRDGQLIWGRDVTFDGAGYRIDIETHKEHQPLQGALHAVLTPFLDALVLRGLDRAYLDEIRQRAITGEAPMFGGVDGRMLSSGYPSQVWRVHMGTGAHISRSRIHSELGQLGADGVEIALALCAQRDPHTSSIYQSNAVAVAQRRRGQDMIDGLLAECIEDSIRL